MQFCLDEEKGYFRRGQVNVMAFDDIYPEGHQSGISILMHGKRIATNGDLRFEPTPGQWQPTPKQPERIQNASENEVWVALCYPDEAGMLRGMNPKLYPDLNLSYHITVRGEGETVRTGPTSREASSPERRS